MLIDGKKKNKIGKGNRQRSFIVKILGRLKLEGIFTKDICVRPSASTLANSKNLNALTLKSISRKECAISLPQVSIVL